MGLTELLSKPELQQHAPRKNHDYKSTNTDG